MHKVKGKYIRLTENELNNIIQEEVSKQITLIMEYAEPRKRFIERIDKLSKQIIQNWCLIHCCTISNSNINQCKNHWKGELYALIENIANASIKGNDSFETRYKAIEEGFFDVKQNVLKYVYLKFKKENITDEELINQVIKDCNNNLDNIITVLAYGYDKDFNEYIESI